MAIKIKFDSQHNAEQPTLVLSTKSGRLIQKIPAVGIQFKDNMNSYSELRFEVYKEDCTKNINNELWNEIKDFKLVWVKEWNTFFEINVELNETDETVKSIIAKSLGEVELSQAKLYNIEINTENDIEREDYEPTILFDEVNAETSLLNRITEKTPHYVINHVDSSIAKIQRTFEFDNITVYDAFQQIAEEIDCLFVIKCFLNDDGMIVREINVYDLEANCLKCNHRGEFSEVCPECGSKDIDVGYGEDTTIFVSTENLANNITYSTDEGSVKNCFRLEAGDDLMTATLVNCNPNGSGYIWYISDEVKEDMSEELVAILNSYDEQYEHYYKEHKMEIDAEILAAYNALVEKYQEFTSDYKKVSSPITGYPNLMQELYNTIDFYLYLNNSLMPSVEISRTTAALQAAKLNTTNLSSVAVQNIDTCSSATATSAVLAMAKTLIDSRYQVKVKESLLDELTWAGSFTVTSYSDEEDTVTTSTIYVNITGNYEEFVKQKIEKVLSKSNDEVTDIVSLFKLDGVQFKNELKKYSLVRLTSFNDCCQSCLDILIEQGIANKETWENKTPDLYRDLYVPYYNKLKLIQEEIKVRKTEISIITGIYDKDGDLSAHGLQTLLEDERSHIQDVLNFEKYLGKELWLEFVSYRREDTYKNSNYISDGLNNAELFQNALEFIETAKKEIYKSATLQHSISATLKNLLVMKDFEPIVEHFEVGNWLKIKVDDEIYLLRLIGYEINYDDLENLSVTFSDVKKITSGLNNVKNIHDKAASIATSYTYIAQQMSKGKKNNELLSNWINNGLSLTNMKIVNSADNQNITLDAHGLLCKEYLPISDSYDEKQLKLINRGIYLTDDNWKTCKTAIGKVILDDNTSMYGVNGEVIIGKLLIGENLWLQNNSNTLTFNKDGLKVKGKNNTVTINPNNTSLFTIEKDKEKILYLEADGGLYIKAVDELSTVVNRRSDVTNYAQLNEETAEVWGFATKKDAEGTWFIFGDETIDDTGTIKYPIVRDKIISEVYSCDAGDKFKISFSISTSCSGKITSSSTNTEYLTSTVGVYQKDGNGDSLTNQWYVGAAYAKRTIGTEDAPETIINTTVTMLEACRKFYVFIQTEGRSDFSGTIKIRNVRVEKIDSTALEAKTEIEQLPGKISLSVSNGSLGDKASIVLDVDGTQTVETLDLSKVRQSFANDKSAVTISGGIVTFNSNTFVVNSTNFAVTNTGEITAKAGDIAGWKIDANHIYNEGETGYTFSLWNPKIAQGDIIACCKDGSYPFRVTRNGILHATGAYINGEITTTSGKIGNLNLSNNKLFGTANSTNAWISGINTGFTYSTNNTIFLWAGARGGSNVTSAETCKTFGKEDWTDALNIIKDTASFYVTHQGEFVSQITTTSGNYNFESNYNYTAADAGNALQASVGLKTLSDKEKNRYDIDGDGKVTAVDARLILRRSVGKEKNIEKMSISFSKEGLAIATDDKSTPLFYAGRQGVYIREYDTASGGTTDTSSDMNVKNSIEYLPNNYDILFDNLVPRRFKYNKGTSNRYHTGFIAQEILTALEKSNLTTEDFATIMHLPEPMENGAEWALRKEEIVALNTWQIQKLKARIAKLEEKLADI